MVVYSAEQMVARKENGMVDRSVVYSADETVDQTVCSRVVVTASP